MLTLALLAGAALAAQDYSTQVKTPGPDGGALTVHCAPASAAGRLLDTVGAGAELLAAARSPGARIFALPEQAVGGIMRKKRLCIQMAVWLLQVLPVILPVIELKPRS